MSAWVVSKKHIDVLVTALVHFGLLDESEADEVGAELWRENFDSVNCRYGEDDAPDRYTWSFVSEPMVSVFKACQCYAYQSCEHPGWDASRAKALVETLGERTGCTDKTNGYEQAPWSI